MMPAPGEGVPKSRQRRLLGKGLIVIVEGVKYSETSFVHSPYIPSILVRLPLPLYRIRRRENRHLFSCLCTRRTSAVNRGRGRSPDGLI